MTGIRTEDLRPRLAASLARTLGRGARLCDLKVMEDGHAGLTFGFEAQASGAAAPAGYVLKLGPAGVPRRGSTDVYRQARLLRTLHAAGQPVPDVVWASPDEDELGAPYIVMPRLAGKTFIPWEPHPAFSRAPAEVAALWRQAATALAGLHRLDWRDTLSDWEAPTSLPRELRRWHKLLDHAPDPRWRLTGQALFQVLSDRVPAEAPIGLVHGDFQPGNALFDGGRLIAIVDWDLAAIGPQGMDVGWLLMMGDVQAWAEGWQPVAPLPKSELVEVYHGAGGQALAHLDWYQAFAHFRMGAIACLNLKLHRDGRRHDPIWERFAPSVMRLFEQAQALLAACPPTSDRSPA